MGQLLLIGMENPDTKIGNPGPTENGGPRG
jgi:hypothetical protein